MRRPVVLALVLGFGLTLFPQVFSPAQADDEAARVAAIRAAWDGRVQQQGNPSAALAIGRWGAVIGGGATQSAPQIFDMASLSKAITGACIAVMLDDGWLRAETTLGEIFGPGLQSIPNVQPYYDEITIAQLVTQTSGLWPDQTQGTMARWVGEAGTRHMTASQTALARESQAEPGQYRYNNENYAILGLVIDRLAPEGYAAFCGSRVLAPAGVTSARLSPRYGSYGAWGGWEMAPADYVSFFQAVFGAQGLVGQNPSAWPAAAIGGGAWYGMGVIFRRAQSGFHIWHSGRICIAGGSGTGTFAAIWNSDWAVTTAQVGCVSDQDIGAMDAALAGAALR